MGPPRWGDPPVGASHFKKKSAKSTALYLDHDRPSNPNQRVRVYNLGASLGNPKGATIRPDIPKQRTDRCKGRRPGGRQNKEPRGGWFLVRGGIITDLDQIQTAESSAGARCKTVVTRRGIDLRGGGKGGGGGKKCSDRRGTDCPPVLTTAKKKKGEGKTSAQGSFGKGDLFRSSHERTLT